MRPISTTYLAILGAIFILADDASASSCFDIQASAAVIRQTPTRIPNFGPDEYVHAWPWIIELDVAQVQTGRINQGPIIALNVQHNSISFGPDPIWLLRRTTLAGVYNVVTPYPDRPYPRRCSFLTAPAQPFLSPEPGSSFEDLRREGEELYGPQPNDSAE